MKFNILVIAILMAITFITVGLHLLYVPVERKNISLVEVTVDKGDSLKVITDKINNAGLVRSKLVFISYVKMRNEADRLKSGNYVFSKSLNIPAIVSLIVAGKSRPDDIKILIPEGLNIWEIDNLLSKRGLIVEGQFSLQYNNDEGYLFPDTYHIDNYELPVTDLESEKVIHELRGKMRENFSIKTGEVFKNLSLEQQRDIIITASILEKEAKTEEDMQLVAGIIFKRLELGMPLQIDATVIYGACSRSYQLSATSYQLVKNCDVTFQSPAAEIKVDGPFNTYIRPGLPLTPISNPGLKSIQATLNPKASDYLYYLSTRDGNQMIYSKTPAEHAANRRRYLGI